MERKIEQVQFVSLDDYRRGLNNHYLYFLDPEISEIVALHRAEPIFKRFKSKFPKLENRSSRVAREWYYNSSFPTHDGIPVELFESYKKMSQIVYFEDLTPAQQESLQEGTMQAFDLGENIKIHDLPSPGYMVDEDGCTWVPLERAFLLK